MRTRWQVKKNPRQFYSNRPRARGLLSGTNIRVPEEEELMTVNVDSSAQSRAQLHRLPGHSSSIHQDHGPRLKLTPKDWLCLARRLRAGFASPDVPGQAPPCPTSRAKLRRARRLRAGSASPDVRGRAPLCPTSRGWLRLARCPRAGSTSSDVPGQAPPRPTSWASTPCSSINNEHRVRQDTQVNRSTEDHALRTCEKVPSGYDGTGALSPSRHGRARIVL